MSESRAIKLYRQPVFLFGTIMFSAFAIGAFYLLLEGSKSMTKGGIWIASFAAIGHSTIAAIFAFKWFGGTLILNIDGVLYRHFAVKRLYRWGSIRDYYMDFSPQGKRQCVIESDDGTLRLFLSDWFKPERITDFVQQHAINARTCQWLLLGVRPIDPPVQSFRADIKRVAALATSSILLGSLMVWGWFWALGFYAHYGWNSERFGISTLFFVVSGLAIGFVLICILLDCLYFWDVRNNEYVATPEQLIVRTPQEVIQADWSSIKLAGNWVGLSLRIEVPSMHRRIGIPHFLLRFEVLREIITTRASV